MSDKQFGTHVVWGLAGQIPRINGRRIDYLAFLDLRQYELVDTPDEQGWNKQCRYYITPAGREALKEQDE